MKSRCTVCNHPLLADIDLAILSGDYSLNQLSDKFGPSRDAFHRHKAHLQKKIRRTMERLENHRKLISVLKLSAFLDQVEKGVEIAAADGHTDRVFKGSHVGSRILHQLNKTDLPLEPDTAYRLLHAPGAASRASLLPAGLDLIPELHRSLVDQTFSPCPPPQEDESPEERTADQPDLEKAETHLLAALEPKK